MAFAPSISPSQARKKYEKYCAPLLHLAGIRVSVIRTEGEGQAKDIMEIMADADAVLVAGGDGTIMEAVTGLMRRADAEQGRQGCAQGGELGAVAMALASGGHFLKPFLPISQVQCSAV